MRFKWLVGDINFLDYGGKWISKKCNNGDFDFAYVMELINWHDATGETDQPKYVVTIAVVAPSQVSNEHKKSALDFTGREEDFEKLDFEEQVELLHNYGTHATILNESGKNARELMKKARKELEVKDLLFGFAMDAPQNAIGSTGWDFVRGDTDAGLRRWKEAQTA